MTLAFEGGEKMNKKILAFISVLLLASMAVPALVQATPLKEKNNDKFLTWSDSATFSLFNILGGDHQYVPSVEETNKLVINYDESFITYTITIGSHTYNLGTDFTYTGHVEYTYFDPVFEGPAGLLFPSSYSASQVKVDYTLDFSAIAGGVDGTVNMRAVFGPGNSGITSLSGTGDLQNVQVKLANGESGVSGYVVSIAHAGLVSGWPE